LRYYPSSRLEGLKKTMKLVTIANLRAEISNRNLPHVEKEC
jgi:hypothetical protein